MTRTNSASPEASLLARALSDPGQLRVVNPDIESVVSRPDQRAQIQEQESATTTEGVTVQRRRSGPTSLLTRIERSRSNSLRSRAGSPIQAGRTTPSPTTQTQSPFRSDMPPPASSQVHHRRAAAVDIEARRLSNPTNVHPQSMIPRPQAPLRIRPFCEDVRPQPSRAYTIHTQIPRIQTSLNDASLQAHNDVYGKSPAPNHHMRPPFNSFSGRRPAEDLEIRPSPSVVTHGLQSVSENRTVPNTANEKEDEDELPAPGEASRGKLRVSRTRSQRLRPREIHPDHPPPLPYAIPDRPPRLPYINTMPTAIPSRMFNRPRLSSDLPDSYPTHRPTMGNRAYKFLSMRKRPEQDTLGKAFLVKLDHDVAPVHWLLRVSQFVIWTGIFVAFMYFPVTSTRKLAFDCYELKAQVLHTLQQMASAANSDSGSESEPNFNSSVMSFLPSNLNETLPSDIEIPPQYLLNGRPNSTVCILTPLVVDTVLFDSFQGRLLVGVMCCGVANLAYTIIMMSMGRVLRKSGAYGTKTLVVRVGGELAAAAIGSVSVMGLAALVLKIRGEA
ncbi:hypothetical protein P154DRAFT_573114 [Amniculicola lignicola CBS 123094]|uniref:Uncharacterized protein n=1 Tax=Amniculicola lignicola CBS 123094 TaxID=1392246 RepID=A0A6A5WWP3_9PLEO|nr:hypothetical protein P154DRAFT_573114 [Amniculicola lignicola CBS 123094]